MSENPGFLQQSGNIFFQTSLRIYWDQTQQRLRENYPFFSISWSSLIRLGTHPKLVFPKVPRYRFMERPIPYRDRHNISDLARTNRIATAFLFHSLTFFALFEACYLIFCKLCSDPEWANDANRQFSGYVQRRQVSFSFRKRPKWKKCNMHRVFRAIN